jgi:hypothetical protein
MDNIHAMLQEAIQTLKPEDFRYTVFAVDKYWDVYKLTVNSRDGLIAFCIFDDTILIGAIGPVEMLEEEMVKKLEEGAKSELVELKNDKEIN